MESVGEKEATVQRYSSSIELNVAATRRVEGMNVKRRTKERNAVREEWCVFSL